MRLIPGDDHPGFLNQREDPLAVAQKVVPGWGKPQTLVFTNKQINAQVGFKLTYTGGEIRWHAMNLRSGLRNTASLRDGIKHFQLRQIHYFLYS